jgi:hypothetical protein
MKRKESNVKQRKLKSGGAQHQGDLNLKVQVNPMPGGTYQLLSCCTEYSILQILTRSTINSLSIRCN